MADYFTEEEYDTFVRKLANRPKYLPDWDRIQSVRALKRVLRAYLSVQFYSDEEVEGIEELVISLDEEKPEEPEYRAAYGSIDIDPHIKPYYCPKCGEKPLMSLGEATYDNDLEYLKCSECGGLIRMGKLDDEGGLTYYYEWPETIWREEIKPRLKLYSAPVVKWFRHGEVGMENTVPTEYAVYSRTGNIKVVGSTAPDRVDILHEYELVHVED